MSCCASSSMAKAPDLPEIGNARVDMLSQRRYDLAEEPWLDQEATFAERISETYGDLEPTVLANW